MARANASREPGRARFALRRSASHFTRRSARWGYALFLICVLVYLLTYLFPKSWADGADAAREFFLILASVAAGAVVLPELSSNLWSFDAERVRRLIPAQQREELAQNLIAAHSDDSRWTSAVWANALNPLMTASRHPWEYTVDMDYDVDVYLDRSVNVGGTSLPVHSVAVSQKSFRVLRKPGVSNVWISIARTTSALHEEFDSAACLARELVPMGELEGAAWQEAVLSSCRVELLVDGAPLELVPDTKSGSIDVVRWYLASDCELTSDRVRTHIRFDFHLARETDNFPVMFSGYYCAGITDISLRLYSEGSQYELECEYFMGRALDPASAPGTSRSDNTVYQQITFSTGKDSILWPGSGVMFRWRKPE
jgi:hypothetical protein